MKSNFLNLHFRIEDYFKLPMTKTTKKTKARDKIEVKTNIKIKVNLSLSDFFSLYPLLILPRKIV